jgi:hypothetical protein
MNIPPSTDPSENQSTRGAHLATRSVGSAARLPDQVLLITLTLALGIWAATGIPLTPLRPWFLPYLLQIDLFLLVGLLSLFAIRGARCIGRHRRVHLTRLRALARRHFGAEPIYHAFRYSVFVVLIITLHTSLKQSIPFINPRVFDAPLIAVERAVHFGINPAWDLLATPAPAWWIAFLDITYFLWFPIMPLSAALFLTHRHRIRRDQYFAAFMAVWLVGVLIGIAVPSYGPCYVDPAHFPPRGMIICNRIQHELWEHYTNLGHIASAGDGGMVFGYGLMAMPSLHVTVCCLYGIFLWSYGPWWRWLSITYAALIFLGSLYSGWHYAIDGYAGLLIAWLTTWAVRRLPNPYPLRRTTESRVMPRHHYPVRQPADAPGSAFI